MPLVNLVQITCFRITTCAAVYIKAHHGPRICRSQGLDQQPVKPERLEPGFSGPACKITQGGKAKQQGAHTVLLHYPHN